MPDVTLCAYIERATDGDCRHCGAAKTFHRGAHGECASCRDHDWQGRIVSVCGKPRSKHFAPREVTIHWHPHEFVPGAVECPTCPEWFRSGRPLGTRDPGCGGFGVVREDDGAAFGAGRGIDALAD